MPADGSEDLCDPQHENERAMKGVHFDSEKSSSGIYNASPRAGAERAMRLLRRLKHFHFEDKDLEDKFLRCYWKDSRYRVVGTAMVGIVLTLLRVVTGKCQLRNIMSCGH
jgi:hypothetical protein